MRLSAVGFAAIASIVSAAQAQVAELYNLQEAEEARFAILDFASTYSDSEFGRRILSEYARARRRLESENRYFDCLLKGEEKQLADIKPDLGENEFNRRRATFTAKADERRRIQDDKEVRLGQWAEEEIRRFRSAVSQISATVAGELNLYAIIFDDSMAWYDRRFELSGLFVRELNENFADGTANTEYMSAAEHSGLGSEDIDLADGEGCAEEFAGQ